MTGIFSAPVEASHRVLQRAIGIAALLTCVTSAAEAQSKCRGPDERSASLVRELTKWVTATDPEQVADRDTLYKIPVVPVNQIALVTDNKTCTKVVEAYIALPGDHVPNALYVIKFGPKGYAVLDPTDLAGAMETIMIMDSKFRVTGGWTGP